MLVKTAAGELLRPRPATSRATPEANTCSTHGWAEAYAHAGGNYYPKLQVAVPFTPATGRRLLVRPGPHADEIRRVLAGGLVELC